MGLLEEAAAEQATRHKGGECGVGRMLRKADPKDRAEIEALLADDELTSATISVVLKRHGYDVTYQALQRHRRDRSRANACACPR
jgi:hypothetical protein